MLWTPHGHANALRRLAILIWSYWGAVRTQVRACAEKEHVDNMDFWEQEGEGRGVATMPSTLTQYCGSRCSLSPALLRRGQSQQAQASVTNVRGVLMIAGLWYDVMSQPMGSFAAIGTAGLFTQWTTWCFRINKNYGGTHLMMTVDGNVISTQSM